jgi:N-acetylneuraminic acid mutarotase
VYVFGGGGLKSFDHILRFDPASGRVAQVGRLPTLASDVAVATIGQTAYVVGGYDDTNALDSIVAWTPGKTATVVAHLPVGLRYAAATAVGNRLIIAGGAHNAVATRSILSFDPATGKVTVLGRLPAPVSHASAITIGSRVYLIGGRRSGTATSQTSQVVAIDPVSGRARPAGHLPRPTSDAAVVTTGGAAIVAGGRSPTGPVTAILRFRPGGA